MKVIRHIGDVHGKFARYKTILANSRFPTMQVGDMGVGFKKWPHGEWQQNPPFDVMVAQDAMFIRGNHDNPGECKRHTRCIADGTVIDNRMYIGGALSIDRHFRYPDFSWWEDEELSKEELDRLFEVYWAAQPEMMITHECPEFIAMMIVASSGSPRNGPVKLDPKFASRTREAFAAMAAVHHPKLWVFGHWHVPFDEIVDGTRFICLPELACLDIDVDKVEVVGELIPQREKW